MKIHFDFAEVHEGMGCPPLMVDPNRFCDECNTNHEFEKCPKCGSWIELGFGLMFGGYGPYKWCQNDSCDWFYKQLLADDEC